MKMKCYIDVNFTIEEDFARFTDKDISDFIDNKELMVAIFKDDLREKLEYFSDNVKDLDVTVTFEEN